ncbi:uncharacterized protein LOC117108440 [Anneissia japonica]|uniref:uncharacterized protein LOC117108440 n=1 Tax=Anneissia japonica TaxID=1529436 RepID=UPI0014259C80|nr:uncharacterized protein LOC117108440 [Anneissia japonica]
MNKFTIYPMGQYTDLTKDEVMSLLECCGASISELLDDHVSYIIVEEDTKKNYNELYKKYRIPFISIYWVLDSISTYTIQPIDSYNLSQMKKIIESEKDDETSVDEQRRFKHKRKKIESEKDLDETSDDEQKRHKHKRKKSESEENETSDETSDDEQRRHKPKRKKKIESEKDLDETSVDEQRRLKDKRKKIESEKDLDETSDDKQMRHRHKRKKIESEENETSDDKQLRHKAKRKKKIENEKDLDETSDDEQKRHRHKRKKIESEENETSDDEQLRHKPKRKKKIENEKDLDETSDDQKRRHKHQRKKIENEKDLDETSDDEQRRHKHKRKKSESEENETSDETSGDEQRRHKPKRKKKIESEDETSEDDMQHITCKKFKQKQHSFKVRIGYKHKIKKGKKHKLYKQKKGRKYNVESSGDEITVQTVTKKKNGKRVWDRKQYCYYCGKADFKIVRHWCTWHKEEELVMEIEALSLNTTARNEKIAILRNKGNLKHNFLVWETGSGQIIPRKRPSFISDADDYAPCLICSGPFRRKWLAKHERVCAKKHGRERQKRVQAAAKMIIPYEEEAAFDILKKKVLSRMQAGKISTQVRRDRDILIYGSKLIKTRPEDHKSLAVSQKMRDLAKLVIAAQAEDQSIKSIRDCIDPKKFCTVVTAVKKIAGYSEKDNKYETPSYARNIGFELNKVVDQLLAKALQDDTTESIRLSKRLNSFHDIKLAEWSSEISGIAHHTLNKRKRNKPKVLPLADDLKKLNAYLDNHIDKHEEALKKDHTSTKDWLELSQGLLARVSLFNKRRSGETERLNLEDYVKGLDADDNIPKEIFNSLTEIEKALALKLQRIEVAGKRDRNVPILLTNSMVKQINFLNQTRNSLV